MRWNARMRRDLRVGGVLAAVCGPMMAALGGCAEPGPQIKLDASVERPGKAAVVFFVDGLDRERLDRLLMRGQLPHIARLFARHGARVDFAVTGLPTVTYPNTVSMLTGNFPGHHGVIDNEWFDRRTLAFQNYSSAASYSAVNQDFRSATIYEMLEDHFSVNIQCPTHRGVTYTIDNFTQSGVDWALHWYDEVDRRVGREITDVADLAGGIKRWPSILWLYFPGVDEVGHESGSNSHAYSDAVRVVDEQIGNIWKQLENAGLAKSTYFVLVTDHGHVPTPRNRRFELAEWIRHERRLTVYSEKPRKKKLQFEQTYRDLFESLSSVDVVVMAGASRCASIHLRGEKGWPHEPAGKEIEGFIDAQPRLVDQPGVLLAAMRTGPGHVRVFTRRGGLRIERRVKQKAPHDEKQYRVVEMQDDPLGLRGTAESAAFVDGGWHSSREWLAATCRTECPDFVPQIVEMFDSPRCGNVVVFAESNWSFDSKNAGGHGSCLAADMRIPMYFSGPGIRDGDVIPCARGVDLAPTLVDLLGEGGRLKNFPATDGRSLRGELLHESAKH